MKILSLVVFSALLGCAGRPSLEQLEQEALQTGDWTQVEERERLLSRIDHEAGPACPEGYVRACFEQGPMVDCRCLRPEGRSR